MKPFLAAITLLGAFSGLLAAAEISEDQLTFFESKIRPVLAERCYECHSVKAEKRKGGLHLHNRESLLAGGDSGDALELLVEAIAYDNPDLQMPPKEKLPSHIVENFRKWVEMGAPDPREGELISRVETGIDYEKGREFWSFRPVKKPAVSKNGGRTAIDKFLYEKIAAQKIEISPKADSATLLRRVHLDLTGLPPTPKQLDDFLKNDSPAALENVIDELLETRAFGERWGRHWLDVVRFAESSGGGRALLMKEAWRFRDYVIDSFAADKPFDQMIREHIAGDLLPHSSNAERREQIVASGFLTMGPTNYELQDKMLLRLEVVDEQIDTVGRAFLGMTIGCARCHDHMFDPISAKDYYAMAGIFRSTQTLQYGNVSNWLHKPLPLVEPRSLTDKEAAALTKFYDEKEKLDAEFAKQTTAGGKKGVGGKLIGLTVKKGIPVYDSAMSVEDARDAGDYAVAVRGDPRSLGDPVPRSFLRVAMPSNRPDPEIKKGESGRRELADWIASPENPLTARVTVNRMWHHLFGSGIVRTVDNFGSMGQLPSHPKLLDFLAAEFVENGWSFKKTIRQIMLSDAYQSSSIASESAAEMDPENRLFSHQNRRRLEAEAIRDSMLAISGEMEPLSGGRTMPAKLSIEYDYKFDKDNYRSVYMPVFRNNMNDFFEVFDFANPNLSAGKRAVSTIPSQALFMMNSSFVEKRSKAGALKILTDFPAAEDEARITELYRRTLVRDPSAEELALAYSFLRQFDDGEDNGERGWTALQQAVFSSIDFRYLN